MLIVRLSCMEFAGMVCVPSNACFVALRKLLFCTVSYDGHLAMLFSLPLSLKAHKIIVLFVPVMRSSHASCDVRLWQL